MTVNPIPAWGVKQQRATDADFAVRTRWVPSAGRNRGGFWSCLRHRFRRFPGNAPPTSGGCRGAISAQEWMPIIPDYRREITSVKLLF